MRRQYEEVSADLAGDHANSRHSRDRWCGYWAVACRYNQRGQEKENWMEIVPGRGGKYDPIGNRCL